MKDIFVEDLLGREGFKIEEQLFLLEDREVRSANNGSRYLKMKLRDRSGVIDAVKWDIDERTANSLSRNSFVLINGITRRWNDLHQVNVQIIERYDGKVDPLDFAPSSPCDINEMQQQLKQLVESIQNPFLASLLKSFFANADFLSQFSEAPGASKIHHAYVGGLLEHTLSVGQLCDNVVGHYPNIGINRDLLITGALLHDLGKVQEYGCPPSFERTDAGLLAGHIALGVLMADEAIRKIPDFPSLLRATVIHMLLSHHGSRDYGSPTEPACIEAFILHFMDDLDAKMQNVWGWITQKHHLDATDRLWTDKCFPLDRLIFKGIPEEMFLGEKKRSNGNGASLDSLDPFLDL
jgi:3'-5' exoribonuclease